MSKKPYIKPELESLSIKETAAGGTKATSHDGYIWERTLDDGKHIAIEEYFPASGQ